MPRCLPMLTSFFDRFLMGFCCQLRPPEPHGSSPRCSESTIYQKIAFRMLHRFFIDGGANMLPCSLQKSTNIASKINFGRHQFFDRFLHRFFNDLGATLEANLELCWPLRRAQDASKTPPRRLPRRSARHFSLQQCCLLYTSPSPRD